MNRIEAMLAATIVITILMCWLIPMPTVHVRARAAYTVQQP